MWRNLKRHFLPQYMESKNILVPVWSKGVGPKFAKRIVEKFGKDTLDVIEETPDELLKVSGIGKVV